MSNFGKEFGRRLGAILRDEKIREDETRKNNFEEMFKYHKKYGRGN